jgi:RNA polymerase sigma-70 factor (ECF subfamily)
METFDIQKFRDGDEALFQQIIETYSERIFHIVLRMLRDIDDAEDIVQETFTRAFMKRKTFRGKSSVYTWLVRIAYNNALNKIKKSRSMAQLHPGIASDSSPEEEVQRKEILQRIEQAIRELPPKQKMVFNLRFYEKMPYKDITKLMKCKEGTAKALYHFALEKLSEKLGDYNPQRALIGESHTRAKNNA